MTVLVVFRSRVRAEHAEEYSRAASKMDAMARTMPGFVSATDFDAADGEHVSIQEWESPDHVRAWGAHPAHRAMQALGRERFYEEYSLQIAEAPQSRRFRRDDQSRTAP